MAAPVTFLDQKYFASWPIVMRDSNMIRAMDGQTRECVVPGAEAGTMLTCGCIRAVIGHNASVHNASAVGAGVTCFDEVLTTL